MGLSWISDTVWAATQQIPGEQVDSTDVGGSRTVRNTYTIDAGEEKSTYAGEDQTGASGNGRYSYRYTILNIGEGSTWRPMDASDTIVVGRSSYTDSFTMEDGSTVDLSYKYSDANGYTDDRTWSDRNGNTYTSWPISGGFRAGRTLAIYNGQFGDNLTFKINLGTKNATLRSDGTYDSSLAVGYGDSVELYNPTLLDTDADAVSHIKIEYVLNKNFAGYDWTAMTDALVQGNTFSGLYIRDDTGTGTIFDKFIVTGESGGQVDGAFHKYNISTELKQEDGGEYAGYNRSYDVYWKAERIGALSQGVYSFANAALAARNLWRIEDGLFWKRGDDLRFEEQDRTEDDFTHREGLWANTWRGEYTFGGIEGSAFKQTYNGIQTGYDKMRAEPLRGGRLYTGMFIHEMTSDTDFSAQSVAGGDYNRGQGNLKSRGIGAYAVWSGKHGNYVDTAVRWSKITNDYTYTDSFGAVLDNSFNTKVFSLGLRYGQRIERGSGWTLEPWTGLSYGRMEAFGFRMDNGLQYEQKKTDALIGRAGLSVEKSFGAHQDRGQAYLNLMISHDFMDGGEAMFYAMQQSGNVFTSNSVILDSEKVHTLAGKDTWYDMTLGSRFSVGKDGHAWVELNKSFGGKVNTKWQLNGGITWRWGGAPGSVMPGGAKLSHGGDTMRENKIYNEMIPYTGEKNTAAFGDGKRMQSTEMNEAGPVGEKDVENMGESQRTEIPPMETNRQEYTGDMKNGYTLQPVIVEAQRPDWEKQLSPGTVSVIDVPKYEGEQKTFADLLETVPGVYIDRLSGGGKGHYTTVRIRGSSASQVSIYMDGILINSGSESAVNLENINIDNIERIEVYRGYIPARFAGAAMGGAINIVTKRPDQTGGKVSYGMSSFKGYQGHVEVTSPVGDGSLMLTYDRDQSKGNFKYHKWMTAEDILETTYDPDHPVTPQNPFVPTKIRQLYRTRLFNGYQNNNFMVKWQDDNWFAKLTYMDNSTDQPESTNTYYPDIPDDQLPYGNASLAKFVRHGTVDTKKTDFSFGRRQHNGRLEWGWKLDGIHQNKEARFVKGSLEGVAAGKNTFKNDTYTASVDGTYNLWGSNLFEFLATGSKESMKVSFASNSLSTSNIGKQYESLFLPKYHVSNYYLQLQDTMRLDDYGSLTFTPLVRAQKQKIGISVRDGEGWKYSYNLALRKKFDSHWTVWGTYGSYYRMPSWYEIFGDGVNLVSRWYEFNSVSNWGPDVYAEKGKNWDVSAEWNGRALGSDGDVTLTYFHRKSKNLLTTVFNPLWGDTWYANLGAGWVEGVELSGKMHWKQWDFSTSATWQNSLVTSGHVAYQNTGSTGGWQGQPLPWTPKWTVNSRVDYRFPGEKLSLFAEYNWTDKLPWFNNSGEDAYYTAMGLFNVGMKYSFNKQFKITAGVNDIGNKGPKQMLYSRVESGSDGIDINTGLPSNIRNVAYPQQGRTYYATLEYTF